MEFFKTLLEKQKQKTEREKNKEITSRFLVTAKDDKLWILHNGYAIKEIEGNKTADEIVEMLNTYKDTAVRF